MNVLQYLRAGIACLMLGLAAVLGGCSTAGSMLVEVDVYKGPLGKEPELQYAELLAIFEEAIPLLEFHEGLAQSYWLERDCLGSRESGCALIGEVRKRIRSIRCEMSLFYAGFRRRQSVLLGNYEDFEGCPMTGQGTAVVVGDLNILNKNELYKKMAEEATKLATRLKVEAFYFAEAQIGAFPSQPQARYLLVGFVNLMSEMSNQIASRTDTLFKQVSRSVPGKELPLSDHLKDAGPTDFLHLFNWYQATLPDKLSYGEDKLTPDDRARLARRLFSDHYWTRINSVYAGGQGEVSMALIKDDIGNWNLKSFDNNPTELLAAYRNLSLAGIKAATSLASGSTSGLDMLSQFARGRVGSTETAVTSSARIDSMRARAVVDLEELKKVAGGDKAQGLKKAEIDAQQRFDQAASETNAQRSVARRAADNRTAKEQALARARQVSPSGLHVAENAAYDKAMEEDESARAQLASAQANEDQLRAALDAAQQKHRAFMADLFAQARKALEIHRRVIDGLKEMQGASPTLTPAAAVFRR